MDRVADMTITTEPASALLDADLLQLIWLASPALPVGGFSYSEGLESAVDAGLVDNADSAQRWLLDQLHLSQSRSDLAVLALAIPAWRNADHAALHTLAHWVEQSRESAELRAQTAQMGRSLQEWLRQQLRVQPSALQQLGALPPSLPIAYALAASSTGAPVRACCLAYAFGWAENMVQAAIKSVPLGQSAGQRMLAALAADIPQAVERALQCRSVDDLQAMSPMLAILSSQHEAQYSRLFRS